VVSACEVGFFETGQVASGFFQDRGKPLRPDIAGKYKGTDEAYVKLLGRLADHQFAGMPQELRGNILAYYKDLKPPVSAKSTKKEKAESAKLLDQLDRLKALLDSEP
jgi:hypothetical protein